MTALIMYRVPNSARIMQKCDCGATIDFIHGSSVPGKCHIARFIQKSHVGVVRYILRDDFDVDPDRIYLEWNDFAVANGYEIIPLDTYRPLQEGSRMVMYGFSAAVVITTQNIWEITIAQEQEEQEQEEQDQEEEQEDPYDNYDGEHNSDWAADESDWD